MSLTPLFIVMFIMSLLVIAIGAWIQTHQKCPSCRKWARTQYASRPHCGSPRQVTNLSIRKKVLIVAFFLLAQHRQPHLSEKNYILPLQYIFSTYFISFDESPLTQIPYLGPLQKRCKSIITLWSKRLIVPGTDWTREIDQRIEQASIILFLVSADFLASDYHNQVEVKRALERQKAGQTHVIPIIVRPADWQDTALGHLQPLPKDGKPIITWRYRDEAWINVVGGIRNVLEPRSSVRAAAQMVVIAMCILFYVCSAARR